jgi:3'-phosphoadenosine 5'-phosphosulfate (PAPS) 3'-phosphatase
MLSKTELKELCKTATKAATEAGEYIQSKLDQHYTKSKKEGVNSLAAQVVTEVDIGAQEIILNHLQKSIQKYDLGLLTEEATDNHSRLKKAYFWCIDPMDGTLPFTEGRTGYAVSIALISKEGEPVIGVVYVPDKAECYSAVSGEGVFLNNTLINRANFKADNALHVFMDSSTKSQAYFNELTQYISNWANKEKFSTIQYYDGYGAVCNALAVMQSNAGFYFKLAKKQQGGGSIWDFAATSLFFEELNLNVSDNFGKPLHLNNPDTTFMNDSGILYTTDKNLSAFLMTLRKKQ